MKHIKLYEDFLNEETQFPAQFEIDEAVSFITATGDDERWGTIVKVSFTKAKVWYDILDDYTAQVIEDVDSSFVKTLKSDIKLEEPTNESKLSYKDLKPGSIYRSEIEIQSGPMEGEKFITDEEYIENDGHNLVFKIVKIHTPKTAKYLDKKIGDLSRTGEGAISRDYSII